MRMWKKLGKGREEGVVKRGGVGDVIGGLGGGEMGEGWGWKYGGREDGGMGGGEGKGGSGEIG